MFAEKGKRATEGNVSRSTVLASTRQVAFHTSSHCFLSANLYLQGHNQTATCYWTQSFVGSGGIGWTCKYTNIKYRKAKWTSLANSWFNLCSSSTGDLAAKPMKDSWGCYLCVLDEEAHGAYHQLLFLGLRTSQNPAIKGQYAHLFSVSPSVHSLSGRQNKVLLLIGFFGSHNIIYGYSRTAPSW